MVPTAIGETRTGEGAGRRVECVRVGGEFGALCTACRAFAHGGPWREPSCMAAASMATVSVRPANCVHHDLANERFGTGKGGRVCRVLGHWEGCVPLPPPPPPPPPARCGLAHLGCTQRVGGGWVGGDRGWAGWGGTGEGQEVRRPPSGWKQQQHHQHHRPHHLALVRLPSPLPHPHPSSSPSPRPPPSPPWWPVARGLGPQCSPGTKGRGQGGGHFPSLRPWVWAFQPWALANASRSTWTSQCLVEHGHS